MMNFTEATSTADADTASLELDIRCNPRAHSQCPKGTLTDTNGKPLVFNPVELTDSFNAPYAVQIGGYCTNQTCNTNCPYKPPLSFQVSGICNA